MSDTDGLAWVDSLAVSAKHRGKRLGEALLVAGLAWARDNRPGPIRIYTDFWRTEAMGLYRKFGFTQAYTGVQFRRTMDATEIQEILSRRRNTYSRWVGFR
jgi:GNAT superfamily N-acetyltransferase